MSRPYRSVLYIPGSNARALEKARGLAADAIIFDLEDAVAPAEKPAARDTLRAALGQDYGPRARIVRINGLDTEWGRDDAAAFATGADAVLVPKVSSPADLDAVAAITGETPLWAMMETAAGMLNAAAIAAHPRLAGMSWAPTTWPGNWAAATAPTGWRCRPGWGCACWRPRRMAR